MSECEEDEDFFTAVRSMVPSLPPLSPPPQDTKILRLEESFGGLVCTNCPIDNPFSTWDEADFTSHLVEVHPDSVETLCIYCDAYVTTTNTTDGGSSLLAHLNRHLEYTNQSAFECTACSYQTNEAKAFLGHTCSSVRRVDSSAAADNCYGVDLSPSEEKDDVCCAQCRLRLPNRSSLVGHARDNLCVTLHCTQPGCLVKTTLRESIIQHMKQRHPDCVPNFRSTTQLLCNEAGLRFQTDSTISINNGPGVPPLGLTPAALQSALMGALLGRIAEGAGAPVGPVPEGARPGLVLCLRCPYCHYSTVRWDRFLGHPAECGKSHRFPASPHRQFVYRLYTCSLCQAVASERSLVEEHVESLHQGSDIEATVLYEEVAMDPQLSAHDNDQDSQSSNLDVGSTSRKRSYENGGLSAYPASDVGSTSVKRPRCSTVDGSEDDYLSAGDDSDITRAEFDRVRFPFDELAFNRDFEDCREDADVLGMEAKLRLFSQFNVRIYRRDGQRRIPECPECLKEFSHGLGDFKRHLMCVHLGVARINARDLLRYIGPEIGLPDSSDEDKQQLAQAAASKARFLEPGLRRITLPYSTPVLLRLTEHLPKTSQIHLIKKMKIYATQHVTLDTRGGHKKYRCDHCSYFSPHALADVRKHVMGSHCGISTKQFRYCLQASRLDPLEYKLLADDRLLRLAKDLIKRQHIGPPSVKNEMSMSNASVASPHYSEDLSCDNNNILPSFQPTSTPNTAASNVVTAADFNCDNDPLVSNNRQNCFRVAVDYDNEIVVKLSFSEAVLRHLLAPVATEEQMEETIQKMHIYSSYNIIRLCQGDKTVAFRCLCKRVFHTSRLPNSKIRAATLADSRRHIMGVHARISHEFLTICCQASRISRDSNFLLYSDDMLLRLATDRPIRLPSLVGQQQTPQQMKVEKMEGHETTNDRNQQQDKSLGGSSLRSLLLSSPIVNSIEASSVSPANVASEDVGNSSLRSLLVSTVVKKESSILSMDSFPSHLIPPEDIEGEVERAIDLPYSMNALERLTDGYCPADYLPQLQAKMDIYASYKVYVTRRMGKRFYACSGCSSASPHGMGDIRKHILGVHAKVPERYKAASMHCSRLSREDNTLLPDHVLLQLAKMKWKGAMVRPLNELTEAEIAAGVTTGGVPSRKSVPARLPSFFSSATSAFSSISMVGPNGKLLSAASPVSANQDQDSQDSQQAMQVSPSGNGFTEYDSPEPQDPVDGAVEVPDDMYIIQTENNVTGDIEVLCSLCSERSRSVGAMRGHIVRDHMGVPAHRCTVCALLFKTKTDVLLHHQLSHPKHSFRLAQYNPYRVAMSLLQVRESLMNDNSEDNDL